MHFIATSLSNESKSLKYLLIAEAVLWRFEKKAISPKN
jgi:hypothetical protein